MDHVSEHHHLIQHPQDPVPHIMEQLLARVERLDALAAEGSDSLRQEIAALREFIAQRAAGEEDRTQQAAFLQQLFDLIPIGVVVHINGIVRAINPAGVTLLNAHSAEEIIGRNALDFVHPDFVARAVSRIRQLQSSPSEREFLIVPFVEEVFFTVDGETRDAEVAGIQMAPTDEGTPIMVLIRDITEEKRQRRALEESESRFRRLVEVLPDAIIVHKDRQIIFVNDAAVRMLHVESPEALMGRSIMEFLLPEERDFIEERIERLLESWEPLPTSKNHLICPSGEKILVEVRAFPFEEQGEKAILLVLRDITEIERMRQELEANEAKFRLLADLLPATVYMVDEEGNILYLNQSANATLGYTLEEMQRTKFSEIVDRRDLIKGIRSWQALNVGETDYYEIRVRDKHGGWRWSAVWTTKTKMDDQTVGLGVVLDITWRKEMERALREHAHRLVTALEEERRRIASELHDEVGQQLIGMKFAMERALHHVESAEARHAIQDGLRQLADLTELVRELSLSFRPAMLDTLGLLPTLLWHFNRYTARTGIRVRFNHSGLDEVALPQAHSTTIYRVIQEGLTNIARHASVDEAVVEIRVSPERLWLKIEDEGKGFDPAQALRDYQSSGLRGMQERVRLLSGKLEIKSDPQKGTVILAVIPIPPASDS